jgi:hypothetical protein
MIPFTVRGVVEQFRCSGCDWAIILEEPFLYSESAQRVSAENKVKDWYSAHDCSQFPKPAPKS